MLDNALIDLLATRLEAGATAGAWLDANGEFYGVSQKEQPTQQGIPTVPQIFFEKLFDTAYGFAGASYSYDEPTKIMTETETQLTETHFQVSALVIQDPTDLTIPTASDVVNFLRGFLTSRATIRLWQPLNVRILRVTDIRNGYFEDDRHRNEATPSFDIVVTHSRVISGTVDYAEEVDGEFYPIG